MEDLILITGAAGHVGANLLHRLACEGKRVRVLLREGETAEAVTGLKGVDVVYGDLRKEHTLKPAVDGVKKIFHIASMVSTINGDAKLRRELFETNVLGTKYLLKAAKEAGVERTIVTGSFSAVGYDLENPSAPAGEELRFFPYDRSMPYERSKVLQEHEVLAAHADGQDVMIVTSCAVVGGHDYFPSRMGRTLCDYANKKLRAYVPGGFEFVAADDIVDGHIRAMERGRSGQKYIISSQFLTLDEIVDIWHEMTGVEKPKMRLPAPVMLAFAEVASAYLTRFHPKFPQRLTPGAIRRLQMGKRADNTKAREELGFVPTSPRAAFEQAYRFHWERGAIKNPAAKPPRPVTDADTKSSHQSNIQVTA